MRLIKMVRLKQTSAKENSKHVMLHRAKGSCKTGLEFAVNSSPHVITCGTSFDLLSRYNIV